MRCIEITNLSNKDKLACNLSVTDKYKFMYDMLDHQPNNVIFSYKFDDMEQFIVCRGDNDDFMIEKINDSLHMKVIEHLCHIEYNKSYDRISSIVDNLTKLSEKYNFPIKFDKQQIIHMLNKLNEGENKTKILEARDQYLAKLKKEEEEKKKSKNINQQGGILIWLIEDKLLPKLPKTVGLIIWGVFEIIDIVLLILASIPGLQLVYGAGFVIDIISIVYCFLRFDIMGMVGGVVSIIPLVGDVLGAIIRIIGKIKSYTRKFKAGVRVGKSVVGTAKDVRRDVQQGNVSASSFGRLLNVPGNVLMAASPKGKKTKKVLEGLNIAAMAGQTVLASQQAQTYQDPNQYQQSQYIEQQPQYIEQQPQFIQQQPQFGQQQPQFIQQQPQFVQQ
ncbi:hypothetical protein QKU48_gp0184 [Fadolivirus algeromassiliense]|jgi:hypothetical protein|uniref:Uncharacterized protein n=1 Tax=Fadolivirus FV1/VV64 TaxID=3070911 RepID=A0A7D3R0F5_9VIRU|nr:hypothetical protein QKU48_gp0184 [Fadolivirus algeromassiliense]QKF93642.1 hypothetical protein Fadolivirus_1_184 [Fadolivirus FV1/VV64]